MHLQWLRKIKVLATTMVMKHKRSRFALVSGRDMLRPTLSLASIGVLAASTWPRATRIEKDRKTGPRSPRVLRFIRALRLHVFDGIADVV
jgi:hypothetical protein